MARIRVYAPKTFTRTLLAASERERIFINTQEDDGHDPYCSAVRISCPGTNTADVFIGGADVDEALTPPNAEPLSANEGKDYTIDRYTPGEPGHFDLREFYFVSGTIGQAIVVEYIARIQKDIE